MTDSDRVLKQTQDDLKDDFTELGWLVDDLERKVTSWQRRWKQTNTHWDVERRKLVSKQTKQLLQTLTRWRTLIKQADTKQATEDGLRQLIIKKQTMYEGLRQLTALTAGLVTSSEWQSPSFNGSVLNLAGNQDGKVTGHITDYTRDQLLVGNAYQKVFAKTFVGSWRTLPVEVLLTNSGMAALTTAVTFLLKERKLKRTVLVGTHSYFQNKELLLTMLPVPTVTFDEQDSAKLEALIRETQPSAVFVDTIGNTAGLPATNLQRLIRFMAKTCKEETYLVVDNTWTTWQMNILKMLQPWRGKVKLLAWESLNKYYQYGLDRMIGGFVWGLPQDAGKLFYARLHAGTILSDVGTAMLPNPHKGRLQLRLKRLSRNALYLARELTAWRATHTTKLAKVNYPHLQNHPAYTYTKHWPFVGSSLTLELDDKHQNSRYYRGLVKRMLKNAQMKQVPLIEGTSFGMNTTRVYVVAMHTNYDRPFLRISVGTETAMELETLMEVLTKALV